MRPQSHSPSPSDLYLPSPATSPPKKPSSMTQKALDFKSPLPTPPQTPTETTYRFQRRKEHPHESVYCHDNSCPLLHSIHCICDKQCTAGAAIIRSVWNTRVSLETLPGSDVPSAFNPTVSSIQTSGSYLSQNHAVVQEPDRDTSPGGSIKKTALAVGKQAWSTFQGRFQAYFVSSGGEDIKGKGVDRKTRNPSMVAMYEKSRTSTSFDGTGVIEKAKQQWVEDVGGHIKERKFSFGLPNVEVIEGIAIEPIECVKKEMSLKGAPDVPDANNVDIKEFAEADRSIPQAEHIEPEESEDRDEIEACDREKHEYMAERADKAKRVNILPTVLEQQEPSPVRGENIPVSPKPPRSPLSRSPVAKLPLGTNHLSKSKGPLAIRNPDKQLKLVERPHRRITTWSQASTSDSVDSSDEDIALDFNKPKPKETDIPVCEKPARTSNWLKNVPLSKSWKQKRQKNQKQKFGTYVDPFQAYADAVNEGAPEEAKAEKDVKSGKEVMRSTLMNWNPFQNKEAKGSGYDGSMDESPVRGRPRERVQHPGTKPLEVV